MYFLASAIWIEEPGTRSSLQHRTLWLKSMMLKWSSMVKSSKIACMASTVCETSLEMNAFSTTATWWQCFTNNRWRWEHFWRGQSTHIHKSANQVESTITHLLHLDAPHGPADINDEHNVFRKRGEVGWSEELDKVAIRDLEGTMENVSIHIKQVGKLNCMYRV